MLSTKQYKVEEYELRNFLIISLIIHIIILLILSLQIKENPFKVGTVPITVNIQSSADAIAKGIEEAVEKPIEKTKPKLNERITKSPVKEVVKEKEEPKMKTIESFSEKIKDVKETVKENINKTTEQIIKKEVKPLESNIPKIKQPIYPKAINDLINKPIEDTTPQTTSQTAESQNVNEPAEKSKTEESAPSKTDKLSTDSTKTSTPIADDDFDKILSEAASRGKPTATDTVSKDDPLSDANWSSRARKTVYFPDIVSAIPESYRQKGIGYSLTARIIFNKDGLAISVQIITSSGDPTIDSIFFSELKKIRVEPIEQNRLDSITKEFSIRVK